MALVNTKRVWLGGLVGGIVWWVWGMIVYYGLMMPKYQAAMQAGTMLTQEQARYPFFMVVWILQFLVMGVLLAALYAGVRLAWGPGPGTAVKVGLIGGFLAGFPVNFYLATWAPMERGIPAGWLLELLIGAVLATLVAGWFYREV
jgi:hypothetical protein